MGAKIVVAVTDGTWFDVLRRRQDFDRINFWSPSTRNFHALQRGELFLFKLRAPHNAIVGGGFFERAFTMPCSRAWKAFGEANGAHTEQEMRLSIAGHGSVDPDGPDDFEIGCRILNRPFFFDESCWFEPPNWSPQIVTFKIYNTDDADGRELWEKINNCLSRQSVPDIGKVNPDVVKVKERVRPGASHPIQARLGRGTFHMLITDIYERRCAVTRERTLPALEVAQIRPHGDGGSHEARNGLLLRRDIYGLFDAGYVTVTPDLDFEVSRRIREEYGNGQDYYALHGQQISVPRKHSLRPDPDALAWHNEHRFRG